MDVCPIIICRTSLVGICPAREPPYRRMYAGQRAWLRLQGVKAPEPPRGSLWPKGSRSDCRIVANVGGYRLRLCKAFLTQILFPLWLLVFMVISASMANLYLVFRVITIKTILILLRWNV